MNPRIGSLAALALVVVAGSAGTSAHSRDDRTSLAISEMKLIGSVLASVREATGAYPSAGQPLRSVRDVLRSLPQGSAVHLSLNDPWGSPYQYRARDGVVSSYQVISFGADRKADGIYDGPPIGIGAFTQIVESIDGADDLILFDGRLTKRPFGDLGPALRTANAMIRIATAAASFAVDNNRYPGDSFAPVPVAELANELVPIYLPDVPLVDGWGRPILMTSDGQRFYLLSGGADGEHDRQHYPDMPCGVALAGAGPVATAAADIVMACGQFLEWPAGVDP